MAIKEDPSILGTVEQTWSDIDPITSGAFTNFFYHKSLRAQVRKTFGIEGKLLPGYVLVEFMNECDGFCLVDEKSLRLVDRGLAVGDVVKRKASDQMSGTVLSTSMQCTLAPVCTVENFRKVVDVKKVLSHSSPSSSCQHCRHNSPSRGTVHAPASELVDWGGFREEDFILFRDWIGQIEDLVTEITIRLANGSVVTVQDSQELETPCYYEDSPSAHFSHRLYKAGYQNKYGSKNLTHPRSIPTDGYCHPGQIVQTKKANLRRGRWLFGAYDPNVEPCGMVVQSRCVELAVQWLFPNILRERKSQSAPPDLLDTDDIDSGDILVYGK